MRLARQKDCEQRDWKVFTILEKISRTERRRGRCGTLSRSTDRIKERTASGDFGKLTQLGLDLSADLCFEHLNTIIERAEKDSIVWWTWRRANYVDATWNSIARADGAILMWHMPAGLPSSNEGDLAKLCLCDHRSDWSRAYNEPPKSRLPQAGCRRKLFELGKQMLRQERESLRACRLWHAYWR